MRLKTQWQQEYEGWRQRSLAELDLLYAWADGLYVKAGVGDGKAALLVVIGATSDGQKHGLAVESGERESVEAWLRVLRDLKGRGLPAPRPLVADGHLGIWGALAQLWPQTREQRCWNHKMVNVLDQVPRRHQPVVKAWLRRLMYAEPREACEQLRRQRVAQFRKLVPKAMETLERGLGASGDVLCASQGALEAPAHDQRDRVPLRGRAAPDHGRETLQAGRERMCADLEALGRGGEGVSQAERPALAATRGSGTDVRERSCRALETGHRLKPVYTPIDKSSASSSSWTWGAARHRAPHRECT